MSRTAPSRDERMDEIATLTSGFTLGQMAGPAAAAALITGGAMLSPAVGLLAPVVIITIIATVIGFLVLTACPKHRAPRRRRHHALGRQGPVAPARHLPLPALRSRPLARDRRAQPDLSLRHHGPHACRRRRLRPVHRPRHDDGRDGDADLAARADPAHETADPLADGLWRAS
jgi:predicted lipid-binding transport protein (Tim44 family)